jgi:hypothetical protein
MDSSPLVIRNDDYSGASDLGFRVSKSEMV